MRLISFTCTIHYIRIFQIPTTSTWNTNDIWKCSAIDNGTKNDKLGKYELETNVGEIQRHCSN